MGPGPAAEGHAHGPATRPEGGGERAANPNGSASSPAPEEAEGVRECVIQKYVEFIEGPEKGQKEQLESSIGGAAYEKSGQSVITTLKTVPESWELGVTK